MRRAWLLAAVLACAAPLVEAADVVPREITLAEAIRLAQENAPSAIAAHGQVRTTSAGVRTAYGSFIPSVNLSAGASRQLPSQGGQTRVDSNGNVVILPAQPWSYTGNLGASVLLFDGGGRFFDLRQAKARASAAEANELQTQFNLALTVKVQFFDVLAEREAGEAAKAQLDQAEQQRTAAVARVRAQVATRSDSLRAEIQMRTAQLAISDARTALANSEASLTRLVGSPTPLTAAVADTVDEPAITLSDDSLHVLADKNPAVVQAQKALEAAQATRKSAWTDYLPSVSLGYSRGGSAVSQDFAPTAADYRYSGSMRLSMSFPLFNGFQREAQVTQAQVAEDNAYAQLRDTQLAAREGLTQALGALRSADERAAAQALTVEAAAEDVHVQQQRYRLGGSTLLDLLASQTTLDQARRDLIRARFDRRVARAQLEALIGQDL